MVLLIIILLSNGTEITYELNKSIYTHRVQMIDNENISQDILTLYQFDSSVVYEIVNSNGDINVSKRKDNLEISNDFQNHPFEFFKIDSVMGLQQTHILLGGIEYGHYYVQVMELEKIYSNHKINHSVIPIIRDDYIFSNSAIKTSDDENFVQPIKVKVEWRDSFSSFVETNLKEISSN